MHHVILSSPRPRESGNDCTPFRAQTKSESEPQPETAETIPEEVQDQTKGNKTEENDDLVTADNIRSNLHK